ncbi:hypothetical protein E2L08_02405 [Palleronia sediminis]|uniref:Sulphotransferase Stf0 domain-containing protein n=1 Tax=Palleronia sediminis TaxID=2547833 RepID=A0A4R6AJ48_9RHOB|nr:Stf0 family sulfotransferase [Palleronia sediminis]TDL83517.1 hypothetical protein E2L08_02405 [Palleronia sediminis]
MSRAALFPPVPDPVRLAAAMACPPCDRVLAIHFTPRSGSSRLTEILARTGRLGHAHELFNPNFMPAIAATLGAGDLDGYIAAARRGLAVGGTLGFEITAHQMRRVFGGPRGFRRAFPEARSVWLIREDIVAQAVSLARMVGSGVAHSVEPHADSAPPFPYDAAGIRRWLDHILRAEDRDAAFFDSFGIAPLRLSYERSIAVPPAALAARIADHAGVALGPASDAPLSHAKIGGAENAAHAARFRADHPRLVARIARRRRARLDLLTG